MKDEKINKPLVVSLGGGIICDNKECDFFDDTVKDEDIPSYLNKLCPKCGENLLTEQDLENFNNVTKLMKFINTLSDEQLEILETFRSDTYEKVTVSTHKEIKIIRDEEEK